MYGTIGTGMNGMSWGMGFGWLIGLVLLVLIIWAVTKGINSGNSAPDERKSALDILKERYVRGEINKEEYEDRKSVLSH